MKALLARIVVLAISFLIVDALMDTVTVSDGFTGALGLAVLYGLVSGVIGTVLRFLSIPLVILTVEHSALAFAPSAFVRERSP